MVPVSSLAALAVPVLDANAAGAGTGERTAPVLAVLMRAWMRSMPAGSPRCGRMPGRNRWLPKQCWHRNGWFSRLPGRTRLRSRTAPGYVAIGSGMQVHGARIAARLGTPQQVLPIPEPDAAAVVALAALAWPRAARPAHLLQPAYLRNKVALTTAERQAQG